VRLSLHEMGLPQGTRTKLIADLIAKNAWSKAQARRRQKSAARR
jgi:hypothetical protein